MGFSENLKSFRKVFKLSQEKFAKEIGISRSQVANYETSASEPNLTTLKRIADFFYVPIDSLLADYYDYINNPVGCFYIKSNLFDHMQRSNKIEIYTFNYRFGAFKTDDNNIMAGMKMSEIYQNEFFDKFKRNMAFDEVGLKMYLADLYRIKN